MQAYGDYATRFLRKAASQENKPFSKLAEQVLEKSMNVLGVTYSDVYFPTFSNELKKIAGYLGAKSNAELVEKVIRLAKELGRKIATSDEARQMLGLKGKDNVKF